MGTGSLGDSSQGIWRGETKSYSVSSGAPSYSSSLKAVWQALKVTERGETGLGPRVE